MLRGVNVTFFIYIVMEGVSILGELPNGTLNRS